MIKVLYITVGEGGSDKALFNFLNNVDRTLISPIVVTNKFVNKGAVNKLKHINVPYKEIKYDEDTWPEFSIFSNPVKFIYYLYRKFLLNYIAYRKIINLCTKIEIDIIHTNTGVFHFGYKVSKKLNIPHVWHLREYQDKDFGKTPILTRKSFIKKLNDVNNFNIAITNGINNYFHLNKSVTIYDGIISHNRTENYSIKERQILFVGSLTENKGILELILVFIKYLKNNDDYTLLIAGTGQYSFENKLKNIVQKLNLNEKIIFLGQREDIFDIMATSTALIVPSKFEAFGLITAEAMLNNCLVIGKNTAGTKEQFDNAELISGEKVGFLYNNEEELLHILSNLNYINLEFYQKITSTARMCVERLYTVEDNVNQITILYKQILKKII